MVSDLAALQMRYRLCTTSGRASSFGYGGLRPGCVVRPFRICRQPIRLQSRSPGGSATDGRTRLDLLDRRVPRDADLPRCAPVERALRSSWRCVVVRQAPWALVVAERRAYENKRRVRSIGRRPVGSVTLNSDYGRDPALAASGAGVGFLAIPTRPSGQSGSLFGRSRSRCCPRLWPRARLSPLPCR